MGKKVYIEAFYFQRASLFSAPLCLDLFQDRVRSQYRTKESGGCESGSSAGSQVLLGRGQVTSQDVLQAPGCSTFGPFLLNAFIVFFPQFDHSRYEILDQPFRADAHWRFEKGSRQKLQEIGSRGRLRRPAERGKGQKQLVGL